MTGKSRRPREDGTRESKQGDQGKNAPICREGVGARVDVQGRGEERRLETRKPSNITKGRIAVSYHAPPLHSQVLPTTWAKRDKLPSARQSINQSVRGGIIQ